MGCDIHCYIEYRRKTDKGHWNGFGGRINPGRFYAMFSIMAGVRKYDGSPTLFKPKGLPDDLGFESKDDNRFYITDTTSEGYVTKAKAYEWVAKGYSKLVDEHWVTNPDWHSHSWLTPNEYNEAIEAFKKSCANGFYLDPEYTAILDCLRSFERQGFESRLVFWFDN